MAGATRSLGLVKPGLLNLHNLAINRNKHNPKETEVLKRILGDQQMLLDRELKGRKFACASLNLSGLILYHIGDKEQAIQTWKKTLEIDPSNLNAIKDLITAYNKFNKCQSKKYNQLLKNATENRLDKKVQLNYARSQAEQAYAGFCGLQIKAWDNSKARSEQIKQFEDALFRGEGIISEEEKRDWLLYTGQAHEKLAHSQFRAWLNHTHQNSLKDDYVNSMENAYSHLWNCLQISEEPMHKAQAWCAIGNTFAQKQRRQDVLQRLQSLFPERKRELWKIVDYPKHCYEVALCFDEANKIWILARLGICLFKDDDLQGAMDAFNKSINAAEKLPDHDPMKKACRLAYDNRAKLYIKKSKFTHISKQRRRNYLDQAREDTKKALQICHHPSPLATSGEVHYLLATLQDDEKQKADLLETALIHLRDSLECQDGKSMLLTHIKIARCQGYMKDYPSATKHYQVPLKHFGTNEDQGSNVITLGAMVAKELLYLTLKWCRNHENAGSIAIDVVNKLKLTLSFLEPQKISQALGKMKREGYLIDFLKILLQAMEQDPNSHGDFIGSCLECICNIQRLGEEEWELLNELSCDFQQWKDRPLVAEADMSSTRQAQPQNALNKAFDYDYYVISDDTDEVAKEWVHHTLLPQLKQYGLKGYSHGKDSRLGELVTDTQAKAMQNSCYICAVITHGFNDNHRCCLQVEMAYETSAPGKVFTVQLQNAKVPRNLEHCECFDFTGQHDMERLALHMSMEGLTMEE